jgi:hypothetical protein
MPEHSVRIDDQGVRRELPDGKVEYVAWDNLREVVVLTTGDGPFAEDVFFVLAGQDGTGCVVPHSAADSSQLLDWLQRLPGFDNAAFIRAMSSTADATFVCWRRSPGTGVQSAGGS